MTPSKVIPISLEDEYKKDTGITRTDIAQFRQWLMTQPHLPEEHITDLDLILTYHSCDRSLSVAKEVLDLHYTLRTLFIRFFADRCYDARIEHITNVALLTPLSQRARDGSAVVYTKILDTDPKNFMFADCIRTALMLLDLGQLEEGTWPGFILIFDLEGIKLGHLSRLNLQDMQQFFYYVQEAMLVKLRGFHYINAPSFMDRLLMMFKPFLKKELLELLFVHQNGSDTLDKYIDVKALPKEAGGEEMSIYDLKEIVKQRLRNNNEYFIAERKKRVCESARPGKPRTMGDLFQGLEGSFKKLDID